MMIKSLRTSRKQKNDCGRDGKVRNKKNLSDKELIKLQTKFGKHVDGSIF